MKTLSRLLFMKRIEFLKSEVKIVEKYLQGAFRKTFFYRNSCFLRISSVTACCFLETLFYNYRTINSGNIKIVNKKASQENIHMNIWLKVILQ